MKAFGRLAFAYLSMLAAAMAGVAPAQFTVSLPIDEAEAQRMLADGSLDSATWTAVAPFYAEPLRVPAGELMLLAEVLPELAEPGLPVHTDSLQAYEPWGAQDVQRFFADYPSLSVFAPVLSFESLDRVALGTVSIRLRGAFGGEQGPQYVSSTLGERSPVTLRLRLRAEGDHAAWQYRSVKVAAGKAGTFTVGHFAPALDDGFVLGRFGRVADDTLDPMAQFLLGDSRTFNGARWYGRWGRGAAAETFVHIGQVERAAGAHVRLGAGSMFDLQAGVTALLPGGGSSGDLGGAVHAGVFWHRQRLHASVRSCVTLDENPKAPLEMVAGWRREQAHADVRVVFLPAGYAPPTGREAGQIRGELDSMPGKAWRTEVGAGVRFMPALQVRPSLAYTLGDNGAASCRAGLAVGGSTWLNYSARYQFTPGAAGGGGENRHVLHLTLSREWQHVFGLEVSGRWYARGDEYWSGRVALLPELRLGPALRVAPSVTLRARQGQDAVCDLGLRQGMRLHERVDGSIEVVGSLMEGGSEETTFSGTLRFVL